MTVAITNGMGIGIQPIASAVNGLRAGTMRALGLRRINQTVEHTDSPVLQGMLRKVANLVKVEEV